MKIFSIESENPSFKNIRPHPVDIKYKKWIQQGLNDTYGISCTLKDLEPIAGPIELRNIIAGLKYKHYVPNDEFRANFHIHTVASDGSLSPKIFPEQCKEWADKMFKKGKSDDGLPPFSAAITDHDRVDSVKEVIRLISQSPDEYKNFKFVAGCEFLFHGYKEPYTMFEAVGLGFNPFDPNLKPMLQGFGSNNLVNDVKKVTATGGILSWAHPINTPDKLNDDFFSFLKAYGINGVEGNYQYIHWDKDYVEEGKKLLNPLIEKFKMFVTGGTDSHRKSIFSR